MKNGYILYEGNGLVVIATMKSRNVKTGAMVQVWILSQHMNPVEAVKTGMDAVTCGDCPHRQGRRSCYVNVGQAPLAVWKAYKRGVYKPLEDYSVFAGKAVRFGAYGDPALAPVEVFRQIAKHAASWTGYTHQWRRASASEWTGLLMASCDTMEDVRKAAHAGWRCFFAYKPSAKSSAVTSMREHDHSFKACPAAFSAAQCKECGLCNGLGNADKPHIFIEAHGPTHIIQAWEAKF